MIPVRMGFRPGSCFLFRTQRLGAAKGAIFSLASNNYPIKKMGFQANGRCVVYSGMFTETAKGKKGD